MPKPDPKQGPNAEDLTAFLALAVGATLPSKKTFDDLKLEFGLVFGHRTL